MKGHNDWDGRTTCAHLSFAVFPLQIRPKVKSIHVLLLKMEIVLRLFSLQKNDHQDNNC